MTRAEKIELLEHALKARLGEEGDHAIRRFVVYRLAKEMLDGRVRELVWTEPPFPELGDAGHG